MKYIRTEKGVYEFTDEMCINQFGHIAYKDRPFICICGVGNKVIKQADTIEELCDGYFADDGSIETYNKNEFNRFQDYILDTGFDGYGFIKTSKGLIYVANMNSKGELELI